MMHDDELGCLVARTFCMPINHSSIPSTIFTCTTTAQTDTVDMAANRRRRGCRTYGHHCAAVLLFIATPPAAAAAAAAGTTQCARPTTTSSSMTFACGNQQRRRVRQTRRPTSLRVARGAWANFSRCRGLAAVWHALAARLRDASTQSNLSGGDRARAKRGGTANGNLNIHCLCACRLCAPRCCALIYDKQYKSYSPASVW